jgi:membrane protease YdiL (CAAX protease family)
MAQKEASIIKKYQVSAFFILTFVISGIVAIPLLLSIHHLIPVKLPGFIALVAASGPTMAAIIIVYLAEGRKGLASLLKGLKQWRLHLKWYLFAILLYPMMMLLSSVIIFFFGGKFPPVLEKLPSLIPIFLILTVQAGIGEEIGWRGYATPHLQKRFSGLTACLIVSVIWTAWHLPLFWMPGGLQADMWKEVGFIASVAFYGIYLTASSIIFTWSFNSTGGSLLMPILLHGSANTAAWLFSANVIPKFGIMPLALLTVLGVILAIFILIFAGKSLNWSANGT